MTLIITIILICYLSNRFDDDARNARTDEWLSKKDDINNR